jgi:hypothetical protein
LTWLSRPVGFPVGGSIGLLFDFGNGRSQDSCKPAGQHPSVILPAQRLRRSSRRYDPRPLSIPRTFKAECRRSVEGDEAC